MSAAPKRASGARARWPKHWSSWIATAGGAGLLPRAPGTAGSLVGMACVAALRAGGVSPGAELALWAGTAVVGTWAAGRWGRASGRADDGAIVIDEVSGQWVALACAPALPAWGTGLSAWQTTEAWHALGWWLAAFGLFRVLDIWKPWPIRWLDARSKRARGVWPSGLGVMADDWLAGLLTLGLLAAARAAVWQLNSL